MKRIVVFLMVISMLLSAVACGENEQEQNDTQLQHHETVEQMNLEDSYEKEQTQSADYILNKNSKIFHEPDCSSAKQMNESNKEYFAGNREDVLQLGYRACKRCKP